MAIINLDYLRPGMILNSDVKDINGHLLLTSKTEITEKHLHVLRAWGITEVDVKGITKEDVETMITRDIDPVVLERAEDELSRIFRHTDRLHPAMKEIFRFCAIRKARSAEY